MRGFLKRWSGDAPAPAPQPAAPVAPPAPGAHAFSLRALARDNPSLAAQYLWGVNDAPLPPGPVYLHLGCGEQVFEGFLNLDFLPHDERVRPWNLLDLWPASWSRVADGIFSEDTLEHFFHAEQAYILCNANRALRDGAVARMLMPSLPRLVDYGRTYTPAPGDVMHSAFGVETGDDAVNMGMRFSGHRWLHGPQSVARLGAMCGFEALPTSCAKSTLARFDGLNLRDEGNSLSFATDLRKARAISRTLVEAEAVDGARFVEDVTSGVRLFEATVPHPIVRYKLAHRLAVDDVACLNVRASNVSSFDEHNQKFLVIDGVRADDPWHFDETMKSRACMNLVPRNVLPLLVRGARDIGTLFFSPAARAGDYFAVGCAEVFALE